MSEEDKTRFRMKIMEGTEETIRRLRERRHDAIEEERKKKLKEYKEGCVEGLHRVEKMGWAELDHLTDRGTTFDFKSWIELEHKSESFREGYLDIIKEFIKRITEEKEKR